VTGTGGAAPLVGAPPDALARRRLRLAKTRATGLLVLAAAGYVVAVTAGSGGGAWGFVRAGTEAGVVGGLADWFAVTALFRRPLGLPIPHTALVQRKKADLAAKLGEFVTGNFLTAGVVREQLARAQVVPRLGAWLADPAHADRVAREAALAADTALDALDEEHVVEYVLELLRTDAARRSYAPVLGSLLTRALDGAWQRPLVDSLVSRARAWLADNQVALLPHVKGYLEGQGLLADLWSTDKRVQRLLTTAVEVLTAVEQTPEHDLRRRLDDLLRSVAHDLQHDPATAARVDGLVKGLLADPQAHEALRHVVGDALDSVRASLSDEQGTLSTRIAPLVRDLGRRAVTDVDFRARLDRWLTSAVDTVVTRYGSEVTDLIRRQVAGWSDEEVTERLELAVGRDLQFIRINGTAVGSLAGLAIHLVTLAL